MKLYGVTTEHSYNKIKEGEEYGADFNVLADRESAEQYIIKYIDDEYGVDEGTAVCIFEFGVIDGERLEFTTTLTPIGKV